MGIPVKKFICASNKNKVLTDFIATGTYDRNREFYLTNSPSMDIFISSNLERLLYHLAEGNADEVLSLMQALDSEGIYTVSDQIKEGLGCLYGGFADVEQTNAAIGKMYEENGYLMDTHTAVAYKVYEDYREKTGDETPALIASTASPYKFAGSVTSAIGMPEAEDEFAAVRELEKKTGVRVPTCLKDLENAPVRHGDVIDIADMPDSVKDSL
jgi:threonine synthase